jgi:hypothetical protein
MNMRAISNTLPVCAALLALMVPDTAQAEPSVRGRQGFQPFLTRGRTEVTLTGGWRQDDLRWNIAGNLQGTNPNILSELTWDNVDMFDAEV